MSEDDLIEANPCKLRNGNWGCKTAEPVQVGDTVRIVTRANKQWQAQVTQIVWSDDQVCICETVSDNGNGKNASKASATSQDASNKAGPNTAATPPSADRPAAPAPADELDAMADRAAEQDDEFDDMMSAMQEFERNPQ